MTPEAQQIAIAEACGFHNVRISQVAERLIGNKGRGENLELALIVPDYLSDLNAIHEAEKVLTQRQQTVYVNQLRNVVGKMWWETAHATAAQRAEAFLHTLNLWI